MSISVSIDLDGVLNRQFDKFREIAERYGITDHSYLESYNGIYYAYTEDDQQLAKLIFEDHLEEFLLDTTPDKEAQKVWKKIVDNPHINAYIVTSRKEENKDLTMKWLNENQFSGAKDVLFLDNKLDAPCSVIFDDKPSHVQDYVDNARMGFLKDARYNKDFNYHRRVSGMQEFLENLMPYL